MSPALPTITARELARALAKAGFILSRQRGSHQIYRHSTTGKRISVPVHSGDMPHGTMRKILRDAGLTVEELLRLL